MAAAVAYAQHGMQRPGPLQSVAPQQAQQQQAQQPKDDGFKVPDVVEDRRQDREGNVVVSHYVKGKLLGKGGFARCFKFVHNETQRILAGKVVDKEGLQKARAKSKLLTEIRIHRSLRHRYVVGFDTFFEDKNNVYIMLEMCPNQTLMELVKRRVRLTEPEAGLLLLQLLDAMRYLHHNNIIHRDLKLGNLFVSKEMEIRVGDFGLATQLASRDERKKTVCGTPNYIAPEILENKNGHSFEVDTWAFGVIMYTMLIGKPPFETADVKSTYKKIRENSYAFPAEIRISDAARDLIQRILVQDPNARPGLDEIALHPFFTSAALPRALPTTSLTAQPVWGPGDMINGYYVVQQMLSAEIGGCIVRSSRSAPVAPPAPQPGLHRAQSAPELVVAAGGAAAGSWPDSGPASTTGAPAHEAFPINANRYPQPDQENVGYARGTKAGAAGSCGPAPLARLGSAASVGSGESSEAGSVGTNDMAAFGPRGLHLETGSQAVGSHGMADRDSTAGSGRETPASLEGGVWLAGLQATGAGAFGARPGSAPVAAGGMAGSYQRGAGAAGAMRPASAGSENVAMGGDCNVLMQQRPTVQAPQQGGFGFSAYGSGQAAGGVAAAGVRRVAVPSGNAWANGPPAMGFGSNPSSLSSSPTGTPREGFTPQPLSLGMAGPAQAGPTARVALRPLAPRAASGSSVPVYTDEAARSPQPRQAATQQFQPQQQYQQQYFSQPASQQQQPAQRQDDDVAMSSPRVSRSSAQVQHMGPANAAAPAQAAMAAPPAAPVAFSSAPVALNDTMKAFHDAVTEVEEGVSMRRSAVAAGLVPGRSLGAGAISRSFAGLNINQGLGVQGLMPADKAGVWVTCWVDVTSKYGLGYLLSNGCVGMFFNDATKIIASPDGQRFEYIERQSSAAKAAAAAAAASGMAPGPNMSAGQDGTLRQVGLVASFPPELKKKVTLLKHFRTHLLDVYARRRAMTEGRMTADDVLASTAGGIFGNATGDPGNPAPTPAPCPPTPVGEDEAFAMSAGAAGAGAVPVGGLAYMKKWVRMRRAVLFRLSNRVLQVAFMDGHSVVLHQEGQTVTFTDVAGRRAAFTVSSVLETASPHLAPLGADPSGVVSPRPPVSLLLPQYAEQAPSQAVVDEITKRVRYARDVLSQLLCLQSQGPAAGQA